MSRKELSIGQNGPHAWFWVVGLHSAAAVVREENYDCVVVLVRLLQGLQDLADGRLQLLQLGPTVLNEVVVLFPSCLSTVDPVDMYVAPLT